MTHGDEMLRDESSSVFQYYREHIKLIVETYRNARERYDWSMGNSETIEALARPFLTGHFTLAIVGEMSAGKSTFINALLQRRDLLATGFGQTTSIITEIHHADEPRYEVLFADGTTKGYNTPESLRKHMALDDEFVDLPIKQVNEMILKNSTWENILSCRSKLEEYSGKKLDEDLLKRYVQKHNRSNIPHRVRICIPFKEEFLGWKIIDTPGVAAKGGVEQETYELLNSKDETGRNNTVDAVVFVNSVTKAAESGPFRDFVEQTINKLPEEVKDRLFLVRTRGADSDYRFNKEQQDREAKKLFVDALGIPSERLLVVDSLMQQVLDYAVEAGKDLKTLIKQKDTPESWEEKSWKSAREGLRKAKDYLDDEEEAINAENLQRVLESWSNFNQLHVALRNFVKKEKHRVYREVIEKIRSDYEVELSKNTATVRTLERHLGNLGGLKDALSDNERQAKAVYEEMNEVLNGLGRKYGRMYVDRYFKDIELVVREVEGNTEEMRATFRKSMYDVNHRGQQLFKEIAQDLEKQYKGLLNTSEITMPNIDFDSLGAQALVDAHREVVVGYQKKIVKSDYLGSSLVRFFSLGVMGYDAVDDKSKPIIEKRLDVEKAQLSFKNQALKEFLEGLREIKKLVGERIDDLGKSIQNKFEREQEKLKKQNERLQKRAQKKEEQVQMIEETLRVKFEIESLLAELDVAKAI